MTHKIYNISRDFYQDKAEQPMTFSLTDTCPNKSAGLILDELGDKIQNKQINKKQNRVFMFINEVGV